MGLRESLNRNKKIGSIAGCVVLLLGVGAAAYQVQQWRENVPRTPNAFYTVDDGATLFEDLTTRTPPFDHEGRKAVRAHVFKSGDTQFVGYLERYAPDSLKVFDTANRVKAGDTSVVMPDQRSLEAAGRYGREVKRPGDKAWIPVNTPQGSKLTREIAPPRGANGPVEPVTP